jgi:hypothetical protein
MKERQRTVPFGQVATLLATFSAVLPGRKVRGTFSPLSASTTAQISADIMTSVSVLQERLRSPELPEAKINNSLGRIAAAKAHSKQRNIDLSRMLSDKQEADAAQCRQRKAFQITILRPTPWIEAAILPSRLQHAEA